ncbi:hypothetical protein V1478_011131 [Vespula squamosa]|uniref:Uncharacterized protein n=1 Tax=Vespula squamosa TaxID=30214 RepID=A0ABD2AGF3_VESSQ
MDARYGRWTKYREIVERKREALLEDVSSNASMQHFSSQAAAADIGFESKATSSGRWFEVSQTSRTIYELPRERAIFPESNTFFSARIPDTFDVVAYRASPGASSELALRNHGLPIATFTLDALSPFVARLGGRILISIPGRQHLMRTKTMRVRDASRWPLYSVEKVNLISFTEQRPFIRPNKQIFGRLENDSTKGYDPLTWFLQKVLVRGDTVCKAPSRFSPFLYRLTARPYRATFYVPKASNSRSSARNKRRQCPVRILLCEYNRASSSYVIELRFDENFDGALLWNSRTSLLRFRNSTLISMHSSTTRYVSSGDISC